MIGTKARLAAYVITWALVVGLGSTVAWAAISRAGREAAVLGDRPVVQPGTVAAAASTPVPSATPVPTKPTPPATSAPTESPAATPSSRPASTSRPSPTPPKTARPTTSAAPAPAPTPSVATIVGTQVTAGGQLTVSCRGTELSFVSTSIADGWASHRSRDPYPIEVSFTRGDIELEVTARCANGSPSFSVR